MSHFTNAFSQFVSKPIFLTTDLNNHQAEIMMLRYLIDILDKNQRLIPIENSELVNMRDNTQKEEKNSENACLNFSVNEMFELWNIFAKQRNENKCKLIK